MDADLKKIKQNFVLKVLSECIEEFAALNTYSIV